MSAIPLRQEQAQYAPKLCILEINNTGNTLDVYGDRLSSQGYSVVSASNFEDGLKSAQAIDPVLIVVYDDPSTNVDAIEWLQIQHGTSAKLAMTPLLVLAESSRL